jgi:peptide/nickel transport system permease protein
MLLRRLFFGLFVLLVIGYLGYFGLEMARGQQFHQALVKAADKTLTYFTQVAQGDLGKTAANSLSRLPVPIAEVVPVIIVRSLGLLFAALLIAAPGGIFLGFWASRWRHSRASFLILMISIIGVSLPSFFAALLLQIGVIWLTQTTGKTLLPAGGFGWDLHLVLPALVLAARPLAQTARITFLSLNEIVEQDYIRTAYSKGLTERLVLARHVVRNAAVPVLTTIGISLRFSLISLPVVEFFFSWPGMGFTLLQAISRQDDNLTVILILALGVLFILVNLLLDFSYRLIDPQLRFPPEHIAAEQRENILAEVLNALRNLLGSLRKLTSLRRARRGSPEQPEISLAGAREDGEQQPKEHTPHEERFRRAWVLGTLGNPALLIGCFFVFVLLGLIAFGPQLAPHSPYTTQGLTFVHGEFRVPPFPPDPTYPLGTDMLGRDLLSLIIAGAQQTLFLAVLVVLARMLLGFGLGALAGWMNGSWLDRFIVGAAEVISAFPALLLAMLLILALGIRNGIQPFIIALCFVGWGETMQFVRSEVMSIQTKLYIESAIAVGLDSLRIVMRHVLPNLIPALTSIVALEMGAVLMLLGELGFIGIFIGGGAFAELDVFGPPFHYSDVPEWGALLSNVRRYARAYPWMAVYPSLAFFMAILGFNFFGEGLRRLVDAVGVRVMRLFNRYTLTVAVLIVGGFFWVRGQTGALSYYHRQAQAFEASAAMQHLEALTDPDWDGRAMGSAGLDAAAAYIVDQFEALGIQAAGESFTYYQARSRGFSYLEEVPVFRIDDSGPELVYHQDFVERPASVLNSGAAQAPVRFVSFGGLSEVGAFREIPMLRNLDYKDEILVTLSEREANYLSQVPRAGLLVVVDDPLVLQRRYTLSPVDPTWRWFGAGSSPESQIPMLLISPAVAERLLEPSGQSLADLRRVAEDLEQNEMYSLETGVSAHIALQSAVQEKVIANNVIGHLPGTKVGGIGSDPRSQLDNRMIVVMAQYDSPPLGPEGAFYPGANVNASGVAVMLEAIRALQESGYQPYRTFLFVAYSGEGFEGGARVVPKVAKFLQTKYGFSTSFEIEAIIELKGLGSSQGDHLEIIAGGSLRLANLFEAAARRMNVPVRRSGGDVDLSVIFKEGSASTGGEEAPTIGLVCEGWQSPAYTPEDTIGSISLENIENSGRALSLALMILGRETDY